MDDLVTSAQAAELLGVRLQTVYAYVSRGVLTRATNTTRAAGTRFRRDDVVRLAAERSRQRAGSLDVRLDTAITSLEPSGRLRYRGVDVVDLAGERFEHVADLVIGSPGEWPSPDRAIADDVCRSAGESATGTDVLRLCAATLAARTPDDGDRGADRFAHDARALLTTAGVALSQRNSTTIGEELSRATGIPVDVVECALACLADHELATSTVAVRAAAGAGARPWLALLAGLSAISGERHGRASVPATAWLRSALAGDLRKAIESDTAAGGFGHIIYQDADPRFELITEAIGGHDPRLADALECIATLAHQFGRGVPNVDLALAGAIVAFDAADDAGETIFATARVAGWTAHAIEESVQPLRLRPRGAYVGP